MPIDSDIQNYSEEALRTLASKMMPKYFNGFWHPE
jgi:hypothetical protein